MVDWSEIEALQAELAAACNEDVAQRLSGFSKILFQPLIGENFSHFNSILYLQKIKIAVKKIVLNQSKLNEIAHKGASRDASCIKQKIHLRVGRI